MKAGTCFHCGEKGHLSAECPKKNLAARIAANETNEEDQSDYESGKE